MCLPHHPLSAYCSIKMRHHIPKVAKKRQGSYHMSGEGSQCGTDHLPYGEPIGLDSFIASTIGPVFMGCCLSAPASWWPLRRYFFKVDHALSGTTHAKSTLLGTSLYGLHYAKPRDLSYLNPTLHRPNTFKTSKESYHMSVDNLHVQDKSVHLWSSELCFAKVFGRKYKDVFFHLKLFFSLFSWPQNTQLEWTAACTFHAALFFSWHVFLCACVYTSLPI